MEVREVFYGILVLLTALCQAFCLYILINRLDHQKFCLMNMHQYGRKKETSLFDEICSISNYLEFTTCCSVEELLNWLNKSAKIGAGFKRTELILLEISM